MDSFTVYTRVKKVGKQKKEGLEITSHVLDGKPETLRELITALVETGVRGYNERQDKGQLVSCLTKGEIAQKAETGKISFGLHEGNAAGMGEAVANAIQCFEDGIYRIFAGDEELTELEGQIPWREEIVFTLIRLTMLSGW